jgi:hypothetical protein
MQVPGFSKYPTSSQSNISQGILTVQLQIRIANKLTMAAFSKL